MVIPVPIPHAFVYYFSAVLQLRPQVSGIQVRWVKIGTHILPSIKRHFITLEGISVGAVFINMLQPCSQFWVVYRNAATLAAVQVLHKVKAHARYVTERTQFAAFVLCQY